MPTVFRIAALALLVVAQHAFAQQAALEVTPSGTARAGSTVVVKWSGPNDRGDYITVVRKGAPPNEYLNYRPTSDGRAPVNPVSIVMPAQPGAYEIRYVRNNPRSVLASVPYEVTAVTASIEGPASVAPDSRFEVAWSGPNNGGDWVTIVAAGAAPRAYGSYVDVRSGRADSKTGRTVATLRAPVQPGRYELRYVQQGTLVIGTRAIDVAASSAAVAAGAASPGTAGAAAAGAAPASAPGSPSAGAAGAAASGAAAGATNAAAGGGPASSAGATLSARAGGAAVSSAAGGAANIAAGGGAPSTGTTGAVSTGAGDSQTRAFPATTGRTLTQSIGSVDRWSGWVRCQLGTSQGTYTAGIYSDQHTQTWTIAGAPSVEGDVALYPATWTVSGSGAWSEGRSASGFVGGDWLHRTWAVNSTGMAAPLAVRTTGGGVAFSASRPRLQLAVTISAFIGNETGSLSSGPASPGVGPGSITEFFPAIEVADGARVTGSSSPAVALPVAPHQPAGTQTTASCTWLFEKGPTFSALQPPPEPPARTRGPLPPALVERLAASRPVRVVAPNGTEDWAVNSRHEVAWTHTLGAGQRFDLDISVDGGTTWLPLGRSVADDGSGSRGAYMATMPAVGSTAGLIRVSPAGNPGGGDVSDSGFKLGAAWLRLLTPVSATVKPGGSFVMQVATNLGVEERYTVAVTYDNLRWETVTTGGYSGMSVSVPSTAPLSQNGPGGAVKVTSNSVPTLSATGYLRVQR